MSVTDAIKQLGQQRYAGSNTQPGKAYHSFDGYSGPSHRGNVQPRVNKILKAYKVDGKCGLDLGCSIGGVSFALQRRGAKMIGVDYDDQAINVARAVIESTGLNPVFINKSITNEFIRSTIDRCDFVVWFSQWMWFVELHGISAGIDAIYEIGSKGKTLFFETSTGDGMAGKAMRKHNISNERIITILKDCFKKVVDLGVGDNWKARHIYHCSGSLAQAWRGYVGTKFHRLSYDIVRKTANQNIVLHERKAINRLSGGHFPKLMRDDSPECIYMNYCGQRLAALPSNWRDQCEEILSELLKANIQHRDIRPQNLLFRNGKIILCDFGWCTIDGISHSPNTPRRLGSDFKAPHGFDDKYSLYKSMGYLKRKYHK